DMLPELAVKRTHSSALLTDALAQIPGIRPLPPQPEMTRETIYCYVFRYFPEDRRVGRDLFVAALDAEGIPCDGRFYEPVYRSDLFYATPENCPQLAVGRDQPEDYASVRCPVSERAAYQESVWLPQFLLLGEDGDIDEIVETVGKVMRNLGDLAAA